jgi:hypothetical protein
VDVALKLALIVITVPLLNGVVCTTQRGRDREPTIGFNLEYFN